MWLVTLFNVGGNLEVKKRLVAPDKRKLRNLKQYKDMSDEEFDDIWEKKSSAIQFREDFEGRIEEVISRLSEDYALDDLNANDLMSIRHLAQAIITLEDYETLQFDLRLREGVDITNITLIKHVNDSMSKLRSDISDLQVDLNITRKVRASNNEQNVINIVEDLKQKARTFYEQKMSYIYCPNCGMLLSTIWNLYPYNDNKITLTCGRKMDTGVTCDTKFSVTTKELLEKRGTNFEEITPESMT